MIPPQPVDDQPDERPARLAALRFALLAHEFVAEITEDDVLKVASPHRPDHPIDVWVAYRATDGGRLWYATAGTDLAEASDITAALVAIKGLTAARM